MFENLQPNWIAILWRSVLKVYVSYLNINSREVTCTMPGDLFFVSLFGLVKYVIKGFTFQNWCRSRKDIISILQEFLKIWITIYIILGGRIFHFIINVFSKNYLKVFASINCVSNCVKFTSFSVIVETHVCVHLNGEIHDTGKNPGEKKEAKKSKYPLEKK